MKRRPYSPLANRRATVKEIAANWDASYTPKFANLTADEQRMIIHSVRTRPDEESKKKELAFQQFWTSWLLLEKEKDFSVRPEAGMLNISAEVGGSLVGVYYSPEKDKPIEFWIDTREVDAGEWGKFLDKNG